MMKRLSLSFIFLLTFTSHCFSQSNVGFTYDASGNRISRSIVLYSRQSVKKNIPQSTEFYSENVNEINVTITPNPTKGHLKVLISGKTDTDRCSLSVFSAGGQLIMNNSDIRDYTEIDLSNQPNGYYILTIGINDKISTWKIIKK